ncbi:MAG: zinc-dependent metalloprotease [Bryobacteraceae bacterium]
MKKTSNHSARLALATLILVLPGAAQRSETPARPGPQERHNGYLPFVWDAGRGKILFEISKLNEDVLYFAGAGKGIGSVELGVDRGASYASTVIYFDRVGPKVNVVQRNLKFRALQGNAALSQGMEESFASSILAALPIESEENGKITVDASPLLFRDAVNIEAVLRRQNQGNYKLDPVRSSIYLPKTKAFPKNTEVEVTLTYACDNPGRIVNSVAPDGRALTIRLHHSFLQPPDDGYKSRMGDPRIGGLGLNFKDYSAPFDKETDTHWVHRFRLEKKDPAAKISEPKQPLVYYLDAGIPEPIRSSMRDGILWWNAAFEAAGFRNAIVVKDPTPDMDPMDIRYSFVFWVNRDNRGFSVGGSFSDPRTGEILAARARMDSARIRTISNYWQSYSPEMPTDGGGDEGPYLARLNYLLFAAKNQGVSEESLVRLRQALVTAHEVGHTLGFPHAWNSSMNDRASVMEYPSPRLQLTKDNKVDLSDAFQKQIGDFDKFMVRYSYSELPASQEKQGLQAIVHEMRNKGFIFTPPTDPRWNRYDDLSDAATYLRETMKQRKVLLAGYGLKALQPGEDVSHLRGEGLWMTYLHHRWAIDSGVRYIGGQYHNYVVKGDSLPPTEIVPAAFQRDILGLLTEALQPGELAIPERLLSELTTDPYGGGGGEFGGTQSTTSLEEFHMDTGYAFSHLAAARTLSDMIVGQILQPETANRLVAFADRQENALTLPEVITKLLDTTWNAPTDNTPMLRSLRRVSRQVTLDELMILGANPKSSPEVRAVVLEQITQLKSKIAGMHDSDQVNEASLRQSERDITRYLINPVANAPKSAALPQPAGPPL